MNFPDIPQFSTKSGNSESFKNIAKTLRARSGARQICPDVDNPKEAYITSGGVDSRRECRNLSKSQEIAIPIVFGEFC